VNIFTRFRRAAMAKSYGLVHPASRTRVFAEGRNILHGREIEKNYSIELFEENDLPIERRRKNSRAHDLLAQRRPYSFNVSETKRCSRTAEEMATTTLHRRTGKRVTTCVSAACVDD